MFRRVMPHRDTRLLFAAGFTIRSLRSSSDQMKRNAGQSIRYYLVDKSSELTSPVVIAKTGGFLQLLLSSYPREPARPKYPS